MNLSEILFNQDPMNTCCKENQAYDEYDRIAQRIQDFVSKGVSLKESIQITFRDSFGEELSEDILNKIIKAKNENI